MSYGKSSTGRMKHWLFACLLSGCTPHFQIDAGKEFVVLDGDYGYDYRATTPDGLVVAVREFDNDKERGDLAFWQKAIENSLRLDKGYALLDSKKVETETGLSGVQMRFGLDREEQAHLYWVTLFLTYRRTLSGKKSRLYVVETGGTEELVESHHSQLQQTIARFEAR